MKTIIQQLLYNLARAVLRKYKPEIIGITGSVGKTLAKEAIFTVLKTNYLVRASVKNYNNEIGLPLVVLGSQSAGRSIGGWLLLLWKGLGLLFHYAKNYPWMLILEMGADKPGDIAYLMDIATPKVSVITTIAPAHLEKFGSLEAVVEEKGTLIRNMHQLQSWAILNADDARVMSLVEKTKARVMTFGTANRADVRIAHVHQHTEFDPDDRQLIGMVVKLLYKDQEADVELTDMIGMQHVYAVATAVCVGIVYDLSLTESALALREYSCPQGRMNVLPGIKRTLVIDDTYNASPLAMNVALETLAGFRLVATARKIAVLGDMLELGSLTDGAHKEVGRMVASLGIDLLVTVGVGGRMIAQSAEKAGVDKSAISWFDTSIDAQKNVQNLMRKGDVVLIKGSQGMRMERITKEIMAEPLRAGELLVRQSAEWS
ncbi:MAG: Mur ligase family protein [bacterium]|nr:Mur ligase family protein [bacterium]